MDSRRVEDNSMSFGSSIQPVMDQCAHTGHRRIVKTPWDRALDARRIFLLAFVRLPPDLEQS